MKVLAWLFVIMIVLIACFHFQSAPDELSFWNDSGTYRAQIIEISNSQKEHLIQQKLIACFRNGPYHGKTVQVENVYAGQPIELLYHKGDWIFIKENKDNNNLRFYIAGPVRDRGLLILLGIFIFGLILIGGKKGFRAILSLVVICLLIFKVLLPLTIHGYNPMVISLGISIVATIFTLIIISGFNGKTVAASIGTICGVFVATWLTWYFGNSVHLQGLADQSSQILQFAASININFQGLLFAGIIIGALGAIMDMTMSIASAIQEIKISNPTIGFDVLVIQGLKVARDIIGTMSNTLILAYVGGAFSLLLVFIAYHTTFSRIINLEEVATEVIRILAGSIGLIAAVPVTAFVAAMTVKGEKE